MKTTLKTKTTDADVADLVEYAINETKPKIKTRRGIGNSVELEIGRVKFLVKVEKTRMKNKEVKIEK